MYLARYKVTPDAVHAVFPHWGPGIRGTPDLEAKRTQLTNERHTGGGGASSAPSATVAACRSAASFLARSFSSAVSLSTCAPGRRTWHRTT